GVPANQGGNSALGTQPVGGDGGDG
ncbi:hypothetical protein, partial [Mycobacterium tuberculosis]